MEHGADHNQEQVTMLPLHELAEGALGPFPALVELGADHNQKPEKMLKLHELA